MGTVAAAALVLVCAACGSQSQGPDQYESREDSSQQQLRIAAKATDRAGLDVHVPHRFGFGIFMRKINDARNAQESIVPELQVGCGEGFVEPRSDHESKNFEKEKHENYRGKRDVAEAEPVGRKRRSFFGANAVPPFVNYNFLQPQVYQISRPYFIPVLGAPGKIPIYFPPQPLMLNPGFPINNPPNKSYLPPKGYLPPVDGNNVTFTNRFNEEEGPVWGAAEDLPHKRPSTPVRPTRRPPGTRKTIPPLVRRPDPNEADSSANSLFNSLSSSSGSRPPAAFAPPQSAPALPRTTEAPSTSQPTRCVWAIISCCTANSGQVRYECFEQLGCSGAFWDTSPCESEVARAAIDTAMKYYDDQRDA